MAAKYYSILTNRGRELEAQSSATGKPVIIKDFVVGDGNGQAVKPESAQTKLARHFCTASFPRSVESVHRSADIAGYCWRICCAGRRPADRYGGALFRCEQCRH
ncbi:phage tail-collar fiber domain-containing protein [Enterobacter sp. UPMP2052]